MAAQGREVDFSLATIVNSVGGLRPSTKTVLQEWLGVDGAEITAEELYNILIAAGNPFSGKKAQELYAQLLQNISSGTTVLSSPKRHSPAATPAVVKKGFLGLPKNLAVPLTPNNITKIRVRAISPEMTQWVNELIAGLIHVRTSSTHPAVLASAVAVAVAASGAEVRTHPSSGLSVEISASAPPAEPPATPRIIIPVSAAPAAIRPASTSQTSSLFSVLSKLAAIYVGLGYAVMSLNVLDLIPVLTVGILIAAACSLSSGGANFFLIDATMLEFIRDVGDAIKRWMPSFFDTSTRAGQLRVAASAGFSLFSIRYLAANGGALIASIFMAGIAKFLQAIEQVHPSSEATLLLQNPMFMGAMTGFAYGLLGFTGIFLLKSVLMLFLKRIPDIAIRLMGEDSFPRERIAMAIELMAALAITAIFTVGIMDNAQPAIDAFIRPIEYMPGESSFDFLCLVMVNALARFSNVIPGTLQLEIGDPTLRSVLPDISLQERVVRMLIGASLALFALASATGGAMTGVSTGAALWLIAGSFLASWLTNLPQIQVSFGLKDYYDDQTALSVYHDLEVLFRHLSAQAVIYDHRHASSERSGARAKVVLDQLAHFCELVREIRREANAPSPVRAAPFWRCWRRDGYSSLGADAAEADEFSGGGAGITLRAPPAAIAVGAAAAPGPAPA